MSTRIAYLRSVTGCPVGCLAIDVAASDVEGCTESYQLSVLNPVDKFDRSLARSIATGRLIKSPRVIKLAEKANMHTVTKAVMSDLVSRKDIPNRAGRAASLWIQTYSSKIAS